MSALRSFPLLRIDSSAGTAMLAIGDVVVIGLIIAYGLVSHGANPLDIPGHYLLTVAPFWLGWVITAPIAGAYSNRTRRDIRWTVLTVSVAWIGGVLIAAVVRTSLLPGQVAPVFVAVMIGVGLITMLGWRLGLFWLTNRSG